METINEKEKEEIELMPKNCKGYHFYSYERRMALAHICNKYYNSEKGYDIKLLPEKMRKCGNRRNVN